MHLKIEHITRFLYDQPISEAYTEMRLRPLDGNGQHCLSFRLTAEPRDEVLKYRDRYNNDVRHFDLIKPHQMLVVSAESEVMTPEQFMDTAPLSPLDSFDALMETQYVPFNKEIGAYAAAFVVPGDPQATAMEIMHGVYQHLKYEKGTTDVRTTAAQAFALGSGVCQDFSHLMLAACRSQGIPARYVSGYLFHSGDVNASHAWVDVYLQGSGWISLDPTHNRAQTGAYVRVAIGRDYGDVPPTRGVFTGSAKETMEVQVKVSSV